MSDKQRLDRLHLRLSVLVKAGHDDLRTLRNRIGMALSGKVTLIARDVENAEYHIRNRS